MTSTLLTRFMRGAAFGVAVAACALTAAAPPALAQQGGGQGFILLPEDDGLGSPEIGDIVLDDRFESARRTPEEADAIRQRLSEHWVTPLRMIDMNYRQTDGIARVSGEREVVNFDLYTSSGTGQNVLRLTTVSGINNLPERSSMRLSVNGQDIGARNLVHIEGFGNDEFVLPPDVLRAGRNRVQIEFRQHHRIFCGPEASFDLWTDIDLSRSGLIVARDGLEIGAESFMMALAAQASGVRPVEIRGLEGLGQEKPIWRDYLVRRFNQVLTGAPIVFSFSDYWTMQDNTAAHARITVLPAAQSRVSFRTGGDGAIVMALEIAQGTDPEELLAPLAQIEIAPQDPLAPTVLPETPTPFADFGIETESFSQRYAIRSYPFRLPRDWLVLTAAKARINLDYAYAQGLPRGAMLLLHVNGTTVRLLPLRDEGGAPITQFPIDFEARLMHPGTNVLTFELFVPGDPENLPCPTSDSPFLQISDTSTLNVPYSPSMSIPDMDLAFAALTPESLRVNEMSARAYSRADVTTLAAALARSRAMIRPSTLHLLSIEDLGSIPSAHHRADRRLLEDTVLLPHASNSPDVAADPNVLYDPFHARRQESRGFSLALSSGWQVVQDRAQWLLNRIFPHNGDQLNQWLAEQRGQAVIFQLDPARPDELWMLRGPDSDIHAIAHAIASARSFGGGPRGQVSVLDHQGHWQNWLAPDRRPILLEPWSRENFRYALGNFVSARPIFFTILMLGLATLSAFVALRLVISTREHTR